MNLKHPPVVSIPLRRPQLRKSTSQSVLSAFRRSPRPQKHFATGFQPCFVPSSLFLTALTASSFPNPVEFFIYTRPWGFVSLLPLAVSLTSVQNPKSSRRCRSGTVLDSRLHSTGGGYPNKKLPVGDAFGATRSTFRQASDPPYKPSALFQIKFATLRIRSTSPCLGFRNTGMLLIPSLGLALLLFRVVPSPLQRAS